MNRRNNVIIFVVVFIKPSLTICLTSAAVQGTGFNKNVGKKKISTKFKARENSVMCGKMLYI